MRRKQCLIFILTLLWILLLFACNKDEGINNNTDSRGFDGTLYQTKVDPKTPLLVGDLNKDPWGINILPETFDSPVDLQVDMLSQEAALTFEKEGFELLTSPLTLSVEGQDNLRLIQPVLTTVKIPQAYHDQAIEDLFLATLWMMPGICIHQTK